MNDFVSRCPECQTAFKVSEEQLGLANGSVRCGSCLHIFKASEHQVQARKNEADLWDEFDDFDLDEWDFSSVPDELFSDNDDEDFDLNDLASALNVVDDETDEAGDKSKAKQPSNQSKNDDISDGDPLPEPAAELTEFNYDGDHADNIEPAASKTYSLSFLSPKAAIFELAEDFPAPEKNDALTQPSKEGDLDKIKSEPLELVGPQKNTAYIKSTIAVLIVCITALLTGAYQYTLTLSNQPALAPLIFAVCPRIGCQVPTRANIEKIRTTRVVVREHPTTANSILIDMELTNHATYEQRFPNILVTFTNFSGEVVHKTAFRPQQYLHGEISNQTSMTPLQPFYLSFEMDKPKQTTAGYEIRPSYKN